MTGGGPRAGGKGLRGPTVQHNWHPKPHSTEHRGTTPITLTLSPLSHRITFLRTDPRLRLLTDFLNFHLEESDPCARSVCHTANDTSLEEGKRASLWPVWPRAKRQGGCRWTGPHSPCPARHWVPTDADSAPGQPHVEDRPTDENGPALNLGDRLLRGDVVASQYLGTRGSSYIFIRANCRKWKTEK